MGRQELAEGAPRYEPLNREHIHPAGQRVGSMRGRCAAAAFWHVQISGLDRRGAEENGGERTSASEEERT